MVFSIPYTDIGAITQYLERIRNYEFLPPRTEAGDSRRPGFKSRSGREFFQLDWTSRYAMRLNSRTGIEGPPVSSLNCDRSLRSGLNSPELVMHAGCRDKRWTAYLCT